MARHPKASFHPFTIYEDAGIPTPDSGYQPSFDEAIEAHEKDTSEDGDVFEEDGEATGHVEGGGGEVHEADDETRRQSAMTRTSISSLPESSYEIEEKAYTPPVIRPSFMRPEAVRRMQMSRSPRTSVHRHTRSRTSTPQSSRSAKAKGSPISRHASQLSQTMEDQMKQYPLVLLHITLLPVILPWTTQAVNELLPQDVLDRLQLLRTKITETVAARGLLIPHPQAEYELLEERLLEALELREERVTQCGHFHRPRDSVDSQATASGGSDSGLGSSVGDLDDCEVCATCRSPLKSPGSKARLGQQRWSIKVYAANGLMRASAWAAAWNEMEGVDVEILPWIDEQTWKTLDARMEHVFAEKRLHGMQLETAPQCVDLTASTPMDSMVLEPTAASEKPTKATAPGEMDLPQVYKPSQIPLSVLLKNYGFLLAQDRRNVILFFLALIAVWFSVQGIRTRTTADVISPLSSINDTITLDTVILGASFEDIDPQTEDSVTTAISSEEPELHAAAATHSLSFDTATLELTAVNPGASAEDSIVRATNSAAADALASETTIISYVDAGEDAEM